MVFKEKITIMERIERNADKLFCAGLVLFLALRVTEILFYNKVSGGEAMFISLGKNMLSGRMGIDTHGDFLNLANYFLGYPLLYPALLALSFKIFGVSYGVAKIMPLLFACACLISVYLITKKYLNRTWALLVSLLLASDPLFFSFATMCRPETTIIFFFTWAVFAYYQADTSGSLRLNIAAGLITGLALLTSLNAFWLPVAYFIYQLGSKKMWQAPGKFFSYSAGVAIVAAPFYAWILLSPERRAAFLMQVFGANSSLYGGFSAAVVLKRLLNPLADLYLIFFREGSVYPFILAAVLVFFVMNFKKYRFLFIVLIVALGMVVFNERAPHYLLITMPVCYIAFAQAAHALAGKHLLFTTALRKNIIAVCAGVFFIANIALNTQTALTRPALVMDIPYYRGAMERYTEKNARIITDHALILAASDERKIYSLALLLWERWLQVYPYEYIFDRIDPDYIMLTERMQQRIMQENPQNQRFRGLLGREFVLGEELSHPRYGKLGIYKRKR